MKKLIRATTVISPDTLRHVTGGTTAGAAVAEQTADKSLREDQKLNGTRK